DGTEGADGVGDESVGALDSRDVGLKDGGAAAHLFDLVASGFTAFAVFAVVDDDVGAFFGKAQGDALTDALVAAGDQRFHSAQFHLFTVAEGVKRADSRA